MLEKLTESDFAKHTGASFEVDLESQDPINLEIAETKALGQGENRQAFSVIFAGPKEPTLSQRIYKMSNDDMGELHLFLVPLGPSRDGMRYEAVFT